MKLVLHDFKDDTINLDNSYHIFDLKDNPSPCIGCFSCWIKTPAECIVKDEYSKLINLFAKATEIIVISKCYYGGYSPEIKNIFDRTIGYIQPFFRIVNGEMHHVLRYDNDPKFSVYFYGDNYLNQEKELASKLVDANAINLGFSNTSTIFIDDIQKIGEYLNEDSTN